MSFKYLKITAIALLSAISASVLADPHSDGIFKVLRFTSKISSHIQDPLTGILQDIVKHEEEITADKHSWASALPAEVFLISQETVVASIFDYVFSLRAQCTQIIRAQGYPHAFKVYGQLLKKIQKSKFFTTEITSAEVRAYPKIPTSLKL